MTARTPASAAITVSRDKQPPHLWGSLAAFGACGHPGACRRDRSCPLTATPRSDSFRGPRETLQRCAVDGDAEAWAVGDAHNAADVLDRARQDGLAEGVLGAVELQERLQRGVARGGVRPHGQRR